MKKFFLLSLLSASSLIHSNKTSILFVRHGQTDWNLEKRVQGPTDNPLNATGLKQAETVAEWLEKEHPDIEAIYSSDLQRAKATAEATAKRLDLRVTVHKAFREIETGAAEGMKLADKIAKYKEAWRFLDEKYPNKWDRWKHTPIEGEETISALVGRVREGLEEIAPNHPGQKIAIFSHGKVMKAFTAAITDQDLNKIELGNCGVIEVIYDPSNPEHPFQLAK